MGLLSFPDVNVWLALLMADHIHRAAALRWWDSDQSDSIAFCRLTQIGVLRLLTAAVAMNGKPLTMAGAWTAYDRLFGDSRVCFVGEPPELERSFRAHASKAGASPKVWADAYLLAFASVADAGVVTLDRALAARDGRCVLLSQ